MSDNPNFPVIDTHCHIHLCDRELQEIVDDALANQTVAMINVSTEVESAELCVRMTEEFPSVYAAIGIHPNDSDLSTQANLDRIEELASHPKVLGIGETGLDWFRNGASREVQLKSFADHIAMTKNLDKTLVIHDRDAHDDVVATLLREGAPDRVVFHCFSGGPELVEICVEHGWYMSFAGNVTFKNAQRLQDAALVAPQELIIVETDSPFMAPVPHRGKENEPKYVRDTLTFIANHKELPVEAFAQQVLSNSQRSYNLVLPSPLQA